jgi:hypothetical protein
MRHPAQMYYFLYETHLFRYNLLICDTFRKPPNQDSVNDGALLSFHQPGTGNTNRSEPQ